MQLSENLCKATPFYYFVSRWVIRSIVLKLTIIWLFFQSLRCDNECNVQYPYQIICDTDQYYDIQQEFIRISQLLENGPNQGTKQFTKLTITNLAIDRLPANTFADISFEEIHINQAKNLTYIHSKAFNGSTASITKYLSLTGLNKLRNYAPDYNIYSAFSSIIYLKSITIQLGHNLTHYIETSSFISRYLEHIVFTGDYSIRYINRYAFDLTNSIKSITFNSIAIDYIQPWAFYFTPPSNATMSINLRNCSINQNKLDGEMISGGQRPFYLDLSNNSISLILKTNFESFTKSTYFNTSYIDFENNPLDCYNGGTIDEFQWLLDRHSQLESRLKNVKCKNGNSLWDLVDYVCQVEYPKFIYCNTSRSNFDIVKEILHISQKQPEDQKHFIEFQLINAPIDTLPENAFADIRFNQIKIIGTKNLTYIHSNAFNGSTANVTKYLFLEQTNKLSNNPPDNDIYGAFSSLINLEYIEFRLESNTSHEIPEYAFSLNKGPLNQLNFIYFKGQFNISKINNYSFVGLSDSNSWLIFNFIPIKFISARAFDLTSASNHTLDIYLQFCSLTESSFESGVFSGSKRSLNIDLRGNHIRFIDEDIFGPFFNSNSSGYIDLGSNPLECDDIERFKWLFERVAELQYRITNAVCKNGTRLWDLTDGPTLSPPLITSTKPTDSPTTLPTTLKTNLPTTSPNTLLSTLPTTLRTTFPTTLSTISPSQCVQQCIQSVQNCVNQCPQQCT